jgi:RimJ/RimL family protein N-acetyltransferase
MWTAEESELLDRFFSGDRLLTIPSSLKKRRLVLEKIVQGFEPGHRYAERDVNFRLQLVHTDYAAIRRYLVDEDLLDRAEGSYWRIGGRYSPATAERRSRRSVLTTALPDVELVPFDTSFLDDLVRVANDAAVAALLSDIFPHPYRRADGVKFLDAISSIDPPMHFAIVVDGAFAGGVGAGSRGREETGSFEAGWWLGTAFWGRGIATAAVSRFINELFSRDAMRVGARVMGRNEASKRVAVKSGMHLEGVARGAFLKGGVRHDGYIYGVTRDAWHRRGTGAR